MSTASTQVADIPLRLERYMSAFLKILAPIEAWLKSPKGKYAGQVQQIQDRLKHENQEQVKNVLIICILFKDGITDHPSEQFMINCKFLTLDFILSNLYDILYDLNLGWMCQICGLLISKGSFRYIYPDNIAVRTCRGCSPCS